MKKALFKILKAFLLLLLLLIIVVVSAVLWPLPKFEVPENHKVVLIKSINIIDVKTGEILLNRDIRIKDDKITNIDITGILNATKSTFVINGKGKYILPGLWNMHTHSTQQSEWLHHPLYIANGVTGIRDMSGQLNKKDSYWAGSKERLKWNQELNENNRISPRYVLQSSYQIDGASSVPGGFPDFFKLQKEEDVPELLKFYKNENVDFIKVYFEIPPKSFRKLAEEAPKYGMHIAGHKPMFLSLEESINLGQRSFEHGRIFMFECSPVAEELRTSANYKELFSKSKTSIIKDFDTVKSKKLMTLMREKNTHWTPTLQTLKSDAYAHEKVFLDNPNLKYIPNLRRKIWWNPSINSASKNNLSVEGKGVNRNFYQAVQKQIANANKLDVPIMAGTDVTDPYVFAGFSLHTELKDLTESGLSNLEAIQTATIIPAKFAQLELKHGTIEVGKVADLLILDANPLENIGNTTKINGVLLNGVYYNKNKLEELKSKTASIASSFHMNIKVAYSLLSSPLIRVQLAD